MNLLAHFYLSGIEHKKLSLGNFLGDFVKGKKYELYTADIKKGILLHRKIDSFTDHHPQVLESKRRLYARHHHYSAVLVDVFYDHILAVNFQEYSSLPLPDFAQSIYKLLSEQKQILPEKAALMLTYMERDNWLYNYRNLGDIARVCQSMSRRSSYANTLAYGAEDLERDYPLFEKDFRLFFTDIQRHVREWLEKYEEA